MAKHPEIHELQKKIKNKFVVQTRNPPPVNAADLYKPGLSQPGLQIEQQTELFPSQVHQSCGAVLSEVLSWTTKWVWRMRAWLMPACGCCIRCRTSRDASGTWGFARPLLGVMLLCLLSLSCCFLEVCHSLHHLSRFPLCWICTCYYECIELGGRCWWSVFMLVWLSAPPLVKFQASHIPFAENENQTWQDFHLNQHTNGRKVRGSSPAQPVGT